MYTRIFSQVCEGVKQRSWNKGRPVSPNQSETNLEFFCLKLFTWEDHRDEEKKACPETWFLVLMKEMKEIKGTEVVTYRRIGVGHHFGQMHDYKSKLLESRDEESG